MEDYTIDEIPVHGETISVGDTVCLATLYPGRKVTYTPVRVVAVSKKLCLITLENGDRYTADGWVYTSQDAERYTRRLVQYTPQIQAMLHREALLKTLSSIVWKAESTATLEIVYDAYQHGLAYTKEENELPF